MKQNKKNTGAIISGVIAAIAASSCCIPPVVAAIAGIGGIAGSFTWIEPFRPYLIGFSVIAIGYAWYNYLKQQKTANCCTTKTKWYQTRTFLISITLFAVISISFPYYSSVFYQQTPVETTVPPTAKQLTVRIEGMTCESCENHINSAVLQLPGIVSVNASYRNASATIIFDTLQTNIGNIKQAINQTGYQTR